MGLNLKETWQNLDKKNFAIVILVILAIAISTICGIQYYQFNKLVNETKPKQTFDVQTNNDGQPKKPSEYNIGIEYNKAMRSKKPVLTLFYADWCGYCIRFMPIYEEISKRYADELEFSKVNVEDTKYEKVVKEMGIGGFPTVYILDPKYDNKVLISNAVLGDIDKLSAELDRYVRIRKKLDKRK